MKRMSLMVGIWYLSCVMVSHAEMYTQQNAMPKLKSSGLLDGLSSKLYELLESTSPDQMGVEALLSPRAWEDWQKGALNSVALKKAITAQQLMLIRDQALELVNILAAIFLKVAKEKKGSKVDFDHARITEAKLQALVGPGLKSPCDIKNAASVCDSVAFQEQWSLLKVLGYVFRSFIRTLEPVFLAEAAADEGEFVLLKKGMDSQNTALFMNSEMGEPSPEDLKKYPMLFKPSNVELINRNVFLTVPLMASNAQSTFSRYLDKMVEFVGTSNPQRAKDARSIAFYWKEILKRITAGFHLLHAMQKNNVPGERIRPDKLNIKLLPWNMAMVSRVTSSFSWVKNLKVQVGEILKRCEKGKKACWGAGCKERYEVLEFVSIYLEQLLIRLDNSIKGLEVIEQSVAHR